LDNFIFSGAKLSIRGFIFVKKSPMLKIGLLGANNLGWQHATAIHSIKGIHLSGIFDPDEKKASALAKKFKAPVYNNANDLMNDSDALDIVFINTPFFPLISGFIKASKHLYIEPKLLEGSHQGDSLLNLSQEAKAKIQIGFTDRFNSALLTARPFINDPVFIEVQQMVPYLPAYANTSVVEDLMIHDIDIVLSIIKGNIKRVHATGINVFGKNPDIVNAHLEFDNGTTVNLTANRIATEDTRRFQFYKHYSRVETDLLKLNSKIFEKKKGQFSVKKLKTTQNHALTAALTSFYHSIAKNTEPQVSISDGCQALRIAAMISDKIEMISKAG